MRSYFPFGGGRQCMGEQFAWLEMILVVATIGQRWRLRLEAGQTETTNPGLPLRPKGGGDDDRGGEEVDVAMNLTTHVVTRSFCHATGGERVNLFQHPNRRCTILSIPTGR